MNTPDFADKDEVLEYAAQLIEESSIEDWAGAWAKRKRIREDSELRYKTAQEVRQSCARHVRAFKHRPELDAKSVLKDLSELKPDARHDMHLRDAWPLAWKGWLNIKCTVICNSNCIPPEMEYRIEITEKGHAVLAETAKGAK